MDAPPQSTRLAVLVPFGIVTLIWGSTWLVIRTQLGVVPASWSVTYRFTLAGLTMLLVAAIRRERLPADARGISFAAILGVMQFVLNFNFVYAAEAHITSGLTAVIYALLLVPNALMGRIFLGQMLGRQLLAGCAIAILGVALLFAHEIQHDPAGAHATLLGVALAFAGTLAASVANVMQATPAARAYPMAPMLGLAMLIGAALDALYAWGTSGPPTIEWRPAYLLGIAYLGLLASALAFTLYYGVIRIIGPAKAAYSSVLVPVIAMLLSTLFEGYRWSLLAAAGAVVTMAGLVVALRARRPNR